MIDTSHMSTKDWRSTIPPAEACTDIGADADTVGDGGMIGRLLAAVLIVFAALAAVHVVASVL